MPEMGMFSCILVMMSANEMIDVVIAPFLCCWLSSARSVKAILDEHVTLQIEIGRRFDNPKRIQPGLGNPCRILQRHLGL